MRRLAATLLIGAGLMLSGCAGSPARDSVNPAKAAEINSQLGLRYMMQGNYERAMEKLEHALTFDEDYGPAHHYLGELYRRVGRPTDAEEHFRKALEQTPDEPSLLNNFGVFLCGEGKYREAEKSFLHVLENPVYQPRAQVYENLGLCMHREPDLKKAEAYLRRALALNPKLPKSLLGMAELSYQSDRHLSARGYLQRYLEVARHSPESLWLGIRVERILGDQNALASYSMLLKNSYPDSEQARLYNESSTR